MSFAIAEQVTVDADGRLVVDVDEFLSVNGPWHRNRPTRLRRPARALFRMEQRVELARRPVSQKLKLDS